MRKESINYPALLTLVGLFSLLFAFSSCDKDQQDKVAYDDKHNIIEEFEDGYDYIPKYEVELK